MLSKTSILVVDDSPATLANIQEMLSEMPYQLAFANSGESAMEFLARKVPDLVLLDIQMGEMDGFEVIEQMHSTPELCEIKVIVMTSANDLEAEVKALALGASDFIHKPLNPDILKLRIGNLLATVRTELLERTHREAIEMIAIAGHYNDNETGEHIWRMADYAALIAEAEGFTPEEVELIRLAAPMHDTGKIGIPDAILKKPAKLDADEWRIMKGHTLIGHQILSRSKAPVFALASEIALNHHERFDGTGYPTGYKEVQIPLISRIVTLADVYDALTMERPYKEAWSSDKAYEYIIAESGKLFDPKLVETFVRIRPEIERIRKAYGGKDAS
jgi:putative two-component system response regulator